MKQSKVSIWEMTWRNKKYVDTYNNLLKELVGFIGPELKKTNKFKIK